MLREMLKSKIHQAVITEANIEYTGSISIDSDLLKAADILNNEKVLVANLENGSRLETYAIPAKAGSGEVCLNGAAARLCEVGDRIIIISFCTLNEDEVQNHVPKVFRVNAENQIIESVPQISATSR